MSSIVFKKSSFPQLKFINPSDFFIKLSKLLVISGFILYLVYILLTNSPYFNSPMFFTELRSKDYSGYSTHSYASWSSTNISHIVFGIASSSSTWKNRQWYIEAWWRTNITRGFVFLDKHPQGIRLPWPPSSPPFHISRNTSMYKEYDKHPNPQAIRMARIIYELFEAENEDVRWYVLGDDDTVFFTNNLVDVLAKYDHKKYWYIGMNSESHASNFFHTFSMGFGGAGYALSYPLAKALASNLDVCIKRYPSLYGSDHIVQSCVADLGVSLTQERGFHQIDLHKDMSGFLSSHPRTPLISLHHLDFVDPIFASMNQIQSLNHLLKAARADESRLLQQSICYHKPYNWTFSVSWGYAMQLYESIIPPSVLQRPLQTFVPWSKWGWPWFTFNTRVLPPRNNDPCQVPHLFFFKALENGTSFGDFYLVTSYGRVRPRGSSSACLSGGNHSADYLSNIYVISPARKLDHRVQSRRECCDVLQVSQNATEIKLRDCLDDEIVV